MRIRFDYIDQKGEKTSRIIKDIKVRNYAIVDGFCELRKAERSFYVGGMGNAFDLDKDEPIEDILYFLGITNADGEIKKKYLKEIDEPAPIEINCPKCGNISEITRSWALKHDKFICECGQSFTITKEK